MDLAQQVKADGWLLVQTSSFEEFEAIARALGRPRAARVGGPAFERLSVMIPADAYPHSHSARYGEGPFPLHTDAAHWETPARFVVLRAEASSSRPTLVLDLARSLEDPSVRANLADSVFTVVNGRRSFLAPAWEERRRFVRYDPSCMRPATRGAARVADFFRSLGGSARPTSVLWSPGATLVLDNWRCVHGRGEAAEPDLGVRVLRRALVEETWH